MFRVPVMAEVTSPGEQRASAIMGSDKEAEIAQMTKPIAERKGGEIALLDEHGETTWSEFDERGNRMIHAGRAAGLTTGDTIALMCGNRREFFEVNAAAIHAGLVVVPVDWPWVAGELAYAIADSDAARADGRAGGCPTRIVIGGPVPDGFEGYEQVLARSAPDEPEEQSSGGPMFYTSGTTGFPKGVRSGLTATGHDPALVALVAQAAVGLLQIPSDGVTLLEGPAYHSAQWALSVLPLLGAASTVVMRHHFDAAELLELVDRYGVTNIHLVPTQFIRLLKLHDEVREGFGGESLVTVIHGAAPCPLEVKQRMLAWWGPVITEYYGGTEGGFLSIVSAQEWLAKPGSLGRPTNTTELMIVADDGHVCEVGEAGQIYFKSRIGTDFEYHKAPE